MDKAKGKRTADVAFATVNTKPKTESPYMALFEEFRDELDQHHDRRERIIKASRDITAATDRLRIFSLQRIRQTGYPIPDEFQKKREWDMIHTQYNSITANLQGINAYRYSQNITGGNQELMEAMSFQYYLETQRLMSYEEASKKLASMSTGNEHITLTIGDYLLGIFDMIGELMRFSITAMATGGQPAKSTALRDTIDMGDAEEEPRTVLEDLRALRSYLEMLDVSGSSIARDMGKKMSVMQECVEKVERASYSQVVRGSERPKGWVPDLEDHSKVLREDE